MKHRLTAIFVLVLAIGDSRSLAAADPPDPTLQTFPMQGRFSAYPRETALSRWQELNDTPLPVVIEPSEPVEFTGSRDIHSVVFSPNGDTLYVAIDDQSIDLWKAAVSAWKEILGVLAALIALAAVLVVLRVRARAQSPGQPHCRRCNYNVSGQAPKSVLRGRERERPAAGTLCPECGVDLHRRRPRRGRATWIRLVPVVVVALVVVLGYGIMLAANLPRQGRASTWFTLFSSRIDRWAEANQIDRLLDHKVTVSRIVTMRPEDRVITGTLAMRRGRIAGNMLVSPDGSRLVTDEGGTRLVCLSTRWGGWATATLAPVALRPWYEEPSLIRFEDNGDLYFSTFGADDTRGELVRWNVRRGSRAILISEPTYSFAANAGVRVATLQRHGVFRTGDREWFTSAPEFMQAYQQKRYPIRVYDEQGQQVREIKLPAETSPTSRPVLTADGRGFLQAGTAGVLGVEVSSGEVLGTVRPEGLDLVGDTMILSHDDRLLIAAGHRCILVRDLRGREWVARLQEREPYIAPWLVASPDGRWLATVPFRSVARQGPYIRAIVLYDLKPLQDHLKKSDAEKAVPADAADANQP